MLLSSVCHRHSRQSATDSPKMTSSALKLVFLYGTLKTAEQNHYLLTQKGNGIARFVQKVVTPERFPLVVATQYNVPFMLNKPGVGAFVTGELFEVDQRMLEVLDRLEDVGNFYEREVMNFGGVNGTSRQAFVYVLNKFPTGLLQLPMIREYRSGEVKAYVAPKDRQNGTTKELLWKEY